MLVSLSMAQFMVVLDKCSETSWSRTSESHSLVLLCDHAGETLRKPASDRRNGSLSIKERDSALKLTAIVPKLERGQRMERVLVRIEGDRLGSHR